MNVSFFRNRYFLQKKFFFPIFFLGLLFVFLFLEIFSVSKKKDIRPRAGASSVTLSLYPASLDLALGEETVFNLIATFSGGSSSEKIDGLKAEVKFLAEDKYLVMPEGKYVDTSSSGFDKLIRVDGPSVANEKGKIVIKLVSSKPGGGPSTDKPITIAKIPLKANKITPKQLEIVIGEVQVVNNQSAEIPANVVGTKYTVGGGSNQIIDNRANFFLAAPRTNFALGETFEVQTFLSLSSPETKVSGVDFVLLYDKKLSLEKIIPNIGGADSFPFTEAPIAGDGGSFDQNYNFLRVSLVAKKPEDKLPKGTILLAKITFKAEKEGTAIIKYPEDNKYFEVVGIRQGSSLTITPGTPTSTLAPGQPSPTFPPGAPTNRPSPRAPTNTLPSGTNPSLRPGGGDADGGTGECGPGQASINGECVDINGGTGECGPGQASINGECVNYSGSGGDSVCDDPLGCDGGFSYGSGGLERNPPY